MKEYNNNEYNSLCEEITNIREGLFTIKERMITEFNTDELRHLQYSLEEMQIDLKEKMILLGNNNKKRIFI